MERGRQAECLIGRDTGSYNEFYHEFCLMSIIFIRRNKERPLLVLLAQQISHSAQMSDDFCYLPSPSGSVIL